MLPGVLGGSTTITARRLATAAAAQDPSAGVGATRTPRPDVPPGRMR